MDIVSAEGKAAFLSLDVAKQRAPDDDALKATIDDDSRGRQFEFPPGDGPGAFVTLHAEPPDHGTTRPYETAAAQPVRKGIRLVYAGPHDR